MLEDGETLWEVDSAPVGDVIVLVCVAGGTRLAFSDTAALLADCRSEFSPELFIDRSLKLTGRRRPVPAEALAVTERGARREEARLGVAGTFFSFWPSTVPSAVLMPVGGEAVSLRCESASRDFPLGTEVFG